VATTIALEWLGSGQSVDEDKADRELIAGFLARRAAAERSFIARLRPFLRREIRRSFPSLWCSTEDLQQSALLRLCELRTSHAEKIRAPLVVLAVSLIAEAVREMGSPEAAQFEELARSHRQASTPRRGLAELFASTLSAEEASVLLLHAAHLVGDGPPLHEALGITRKRARRKLLRAQDALLDVTRGGDE
jgi:hypothetical protein